jgi:hypothetical protein
MIAAAHSEMGSRSAFPHLPVEISSLKKIQKLWNFQKNRIFTEYLYARYVDPAYPDPGPYPS